MTALKPIENLRVRGAELVTDRYPSNKVCAVPGCQEKVELRPDGTPTVHHCFPRSLTKSDSYYVERVDLGQDDTETVTILPHAVGLCGSGTTGHHGDVEDHRAWIKLEDGVWNWYARELTDSEEPFEAFDAQVVWNLLGPLDPQPGVLVSVEKKKRRVFKGEEKRNRQNWQIKVPKDAMEDGAGILDDLLVQCRYKLEAAGLYTGEEAAEVPPYYILVAALTDWTTS